MVNATVLTMCEQYEKLPLLINPENCAGKTYIVTGANSGLGLETARHLIRCSAAQVILAVRNVAAGEEARADLEKTTKRTGVAKVWKLDLSSFDSVRSFANKATDELERVDSLIENAGVFLDRWELHEGMETCIAVNVAGTMLLAALLMPKLMESASKYDIKPRLVFLVSRLGLNMKDALDKCGSDKIFDGLRDPTICRMDQRYVETHTFNQLGGVPS